MDFNFRFAECVRDIDRLAKFILSQSLNYPDYKDWVERSRQELLLGYKQGILALSDDFLVGNLVFQPHKELARTLELKNMRIHPKLQRRYFGAFMLKQAEIEKKDYDAIICDTRSDQFEVISLLKYCGYDELFRTSLYDNNVEDVVFGKRLKG